MSDASTRRLLVVANRTESTPRLLEEIERRARDGCEIKLIVPPERHPDAPDWTPEDALELVERAANGRPVGLVDCGADAAATIGELVEQRRVRRDPALDAARAPPALAPPQPAGAHPGARDPGDRDPAGPDRLVVLARLPRRLGPDRGRPAHIAAQTRRLSDSRGRPSRRPGRFRR